MNEIAKRQEVEAMPWQPPMLSPVQQMLQMVERVAMADLPMEKLERMLDLQERVMLQQAKAEYAEAISLAKAEIPPIIKNRKVDFTSTKGRTHYRHEDMAGIAKVVDPILAKHGLSYRYRSAQDAQSLTVTCIVAHRGGYSEETTLSAPFDLSGNKNAHQGVGSAATYLQRYTLKLALGLSATTDDDGKQGGADAAPLTAEQFQQLRDKIEATGANEDRFLAYLGIEHLEELPAVRFNAAMTALAKKTKPNA